jgi:CheY-like chemotaxis protein
LRRINSSFGAELHGNSLVGLRVLAVEDEFPVLLLLEEMLLELGCEIAGSASRVGEALDILAREVPGAAVLDVNVAGVEVYPVAQALAALGVPVVFSTGYGEHGVREAWQKHPILQKPYRVEDLGRALLTAIAGNARPPGVRTTA